jgi:heptosyltransferase-1
MLSIIASWFIRLLGFTLRIQHINARVWQSPVGLGKPVVYGFWHGEQFILCYARRGKNISIMSSLSKDGELQTGILKQLGYSVVRGSSSKGAERALVEMIRNVKAGSSAAFAIDGPRGPYHKVKSGVLYLAQKTGSLLIPVSCASNKHFVFSKAWDKYELPHPFSRCVIAYGKPVFVGPGENVDEKSAAYESALERLSRFTHNNYFSTDIESYLENHPSPKILIVQPSRIGDVVFTMPSAVALRKKFPHAWIGWVVDERCAPLLAGHPAVDEVIVFDRSKASLSYILDFRRKLREMQIDLSLDFHGLFKSAFVVALAGARFRLGSSSTYGMKELAWLFSTEIAPPSPQAHCVQRHLQVARDLGCADEPCSYQISVGNAAREAIKQICKSAGLDVEKPFVALHPGGGWLSRRWPAESFAKLIDRLVGEIGIEVALIGGKEGGAGECGIDEGIMKSLSSSAVNLTGKMELSQLVAFLEKATVFVGNEAGPMHIAVALGRPVVGIIGPTNPERTGPFGGNARFVRASVPCQPCRNRNCKTIECMRLITVDGVFNAVAASLKENP